MLMTCSETRVWLGKLKVSCRLKKEDEIKFKEAVSSKSNIKLH